MADENTVTIELDENGQPVKAPEKKPETGEKQYVTTAELEEIRKQLNGLSYIGRKFGEVDQKLAQLLKTPSSPRVQPASDSADPDDVLLEKDWKAAVRKQARVEAEAMWAEQKRLNEHESAASESRNRLESAKKHVIDKYPDILKNDTELASRDTAIINEHPEYLHNDFGPILAMRDMEDKLRQEGRLDEFSKKAVETEVQRRTRADGGSTTKGSVTGKTTKSITLTAEQKAVADSLGVKYEVYAKMLERQPKEGVEV